ncbi:MAG: hypothetical protein GXY48_05500 [Methanomicrobiales archaeon]|nr:hypothetical protein [Methanomicrobiales archaeon]
MMTDAKKESALERRIIFSCIRRTTQLPAYPGSGTKPVDKILYAIIILN